MCAALSLIRSREACSLSGEPAWQARRGCSECCGQQRAVCFGAQPRRMWGRRLACRRRRTASRIWTLNAIERQLLHGAAQGEMCLHSCESCLSGQLQPHRFFNSLSSLQISAAFECSQLMSYARVGTALKLTNSYELAKDKVRHPMSGVRCFFIPVQGSLDWMAGSVDQIAEPPLDPELHDVQRCAAEVSRAVPKSLQEALSAGEDTREGRRRLTKVGGEEDSGAAAAPAPGLLPPTGALP